MVELFDICCNYRLHFGFSFYKKFIGSRIGKYDERFKKQKTWKI